MLLTKRIPATVFEGIQHATVKIFLFRCERKSFDSPGAFCRFLLILYLAIAKNNHVHEACALQEDKQGTDC